MAAVDVTVSGILYDKINRTTQQVVLVGEASLTGVGIGGGPIPPVGQPPAPGVPTHPIMLPGMPGWGDPHPAHPIELPKPPTEPPPIDPAVPPVTWKPVWTPNDGWVVVGVINPDIPHPTPSS